MKGVNHTEDQFLQNIKAVIDANMHNENFGVSELASQLGMSRITLHRKVKSVISKSVSAFIRETRLKRARELLQEKDLTVSEIAYKVGFGSVTYFTKCFHDYYGYPPGEAKKHQVTPTLNKSPLSEGKPAFRKRWIQVAAAAVIIFVAVISIVSSFSGLFWKEKTRTKNTIAILPFVNDSGEAFAPFTNWMAIEIGNKLSKIENMLVVPQSTTETYRNTNKSNSDIAHELMVGHILRGRTFKTGNRILVNIELLEAKNNKVIFNEIYERKLDDTEKSDLNRLFEICGNVVFQISHALQASLTPNEKNNVNRKPTENMAALRAYQEGTHYIDLSSIKEHSDIRDAYEQFMKAKKLFEEAIKYDSTYADAYTILGHIYVNRLPYYADMYLADRYLDTGKIYLEKALQIDENNFEAASYLRLTYIKKGSLKEADKLLPITENRVRNYSYYMGKLNEFHELNDSYHKLETYFNYLESKPPDMSPRDYITNRIFYVYLSAGFPVRARELNEEVFRIAHDTLHYLERKADWEINFGSKDSALTVFSQIDKKVKISFNDNYHYYKIVFYNLDREYTKALDTLRMLEEKVLLVRNPVPVNFEVGGFTYYINGMKEKAGYHIENSIKFSEDEIRLNSIRARNYSSHFTLARIYATLNDKQKAMQYLGMIKESPSVSLQMIKDLKNNPMFDNVRQDPEFQKLTGELEKKYLKNHDSIKELLISRGLEPV